MAVHEDESQTGAAPGATRDPNQLAHKHKSKDPSLIFSFLNLRKWALPLFVYLLVMAVEDGSRFLLSGSHLNLASPRRAIAQQVGAYSVIGSAHIRLLGVRAAPAPPSIVLADALLGPIDTEADTSPEDGDDPFDEDDEDMEDAYLASVASSNNADTLDDIVGMDLYLEEIEEDADEKLGLLRRQTVTLSPLLTISSSASTPETTRTISTPSPTLTSTRASTVSSSGVPPSQTSSVPLPTTSTVTLDTLPYNFTLAAVNFGLPTNGAAEPLVLGQAGVTSGMSFHVTSTYSSFPYNDYPFLSLISRSLRAFTVQGEWITNATDVIQPFLGFNLAGFKKIDGGSSINNRDTDEKFVHVYRSAIPPWRSSSSVPPSKLYRRDKSPGPVPWGATESKLISRRQTPPVPHPAGEMSWVTSRIYGGEAVKIYSAVQSVSSTGTQTLLGIYEGITDSWWLCDVNVIHPYYPTTARPQRNVVFNDTTSVSGGDAWMEGRGCDKVWIYILQVSGS